MINSRVYRKPKDLQHLTQLLESSTINKNFKVDVIKDLVKNQIPVMLFYSYTNQLKLTGFAYLENDKIVIKNMRNTDITAKTPKTDLLEIYCNIRQIELF
jgi:hypothetical protein